MDFFDYWISEEVGLERIRRSLGNSVGKVARQSGEDVEAAGSNAGYGAICGTRF
jgi:hypothetical protein